MSMRRIGSRESDLSVWLNWLLVLPIQDRQRLRGLNPENKWAEQSSMALPSRVTAITAVTASSTEALIAVLTEDGWVWAVRQ